MAGPVTLAHKTSALTELHIPGYTFTCKLPGYWMQMQGQMEVCDLDECDFFQVKLTL
jgi:azurin